MASFEIKLATEDVEKLRRINPLSAKNGGWQSFLVFLRKKVDFESERIFLNEDEISRVERYALKYGRGGWQNILLRIMDKAMEAMQKSVISPIDPDIEEENPEEFCEGFDEGEMHGSVTSKVVLEKADRSLAELFRWHQTNRIIVDPEWQRNYVWDRCRASKLIESFLLDIPVPVIYLAKRSDGKYEVIDGLQRLTSIYDFFENKYKLTRLDMLTQYQDMYFRDLPEEIRNKLEDSILRSFELSGDQNSEIHFIVFERLNTGGIKLNDMEIRNCLFRGSLNMLIKELAEDVDFTKALNQVALKKRMQDRALVLRFLAFYEKTYLKCKHGLKRFLNEFLEMYRNPTEDKLGEFRDVFRKCMKACVTVFGDSAFRLRAESKKPGKSAGEWANRPNAAIFQVISTSFSEFGLPEITRCADAIYEEYLDLIQNDEKWVDCIRRATGEYSRLFYSFETWNQRLRDLMANSVKNDSKRSFSRQLKKQMFSTNNTCHICGQEIVLIDDAALDHDLHYWRGGQTVPENARLVHKICNLTKKH